MDEIKIETRGRHMKISKVIDNQEGYCRKCNKVKSLSEFYEAPYVMLDTNGHMSICKLCCNNLYDQYFAIHNSVEKALHCTCRDLDLRYSMDAVNATKTHIEKALAKNHTIDKLFGVYKSKLSSLVAKNSGVEEIRYQDSDKPAFGTDSVGNSMNQSQDMVQDVNIILFWGHGFQDEDILFLENELSLWKLQYRCDNQGSLILFKEICVKMLEIRKLRAEGKSTTKAVEELQVLMKTAGVDPARAKDIDSDKNKDAYGLWIKDIEETEPAEYFKDKALFNDFDKFRDYADKFIFRPLRNLLLGSRDFNIGDFDVHKQEDTSEDDDLDDDELFNDDKLEEGDSNAN